MALVSSAQAHFRTDRYDHFINHLRPLLNSEVTIERYEIEVTTQNLSCPPPHLETVRKTVNLSRELRDPIPPSIESFRDLLTREIRQIPPEETGLLGRLQNLLDLINNPATGPGGFSAFHASLERARVDGGLSRIAQDCEESFSTPNHLRRRVTVTYGPRDGEQRQATFSAEN